MKAPNHGCRLKVFGRRLLDQWVGYPVYLPQMSGRAMRGHILTHGGGEESHLIAVFTNDRVRISYGREDWAA